MNENIDLTKILKDCPKGWKFYSTLYGEVEFDKIKKESEYPITIITKHGNNSDIKSDGRYYGEYDDGECTLFPSKDQRDWSKFTAPWLKKEKNTIAWLERQGKKSSWKPSKEEMDALYSLSYITNEYDEHKEDVITHLYQDLKREFFNDLSYENMFSLDNNEDDVRRRSTIQVLEYVRSLDAYNQYGKADIDKNIAWLEKKGKQASAKTNERAWLYFVSDVLTWKDGIGQYLDDPRVQELAKRLCSEYVQKLYNPSNTGKNEQKSTDKIEPRFKVGDWVVRGDTIAQIVDIQEQYYVGFDINGKDFVSSRFLNGDKIHLWTINDAKDGDVLALSWLEDKNLWEKIIIFKKYHSEGIKGFNMPCVEGYGNTFKNGKMAFTEKVPYYSKTWTCNLHPATKEQRDLLFQKIKETGYKWNTETNTFEKLVEPKFDPKTLKPFDKVLVKDFDETSYWTCNLFSHYNKNKGFYYCSSVPFDVCIPYNNDTKHLVGTTDEAPEFYRYWED